MPFLLAATLAAAPLSAAFADTLSPEAQLDRSFDRAAVADLHHAGADLAPVRVTTPGKDGKASTIAWQAPSKGRIAATRNWSERAETELLNRASYDANGKLQQGTPIAPDDAVRDVVALRTDIGKHALNQAWQEDAVTIHAVQAEMPRS
jgi:hypothetical protein